VVGVIEVLPCRRTAGWIGLAADEPGLPRRHRRNAGNLFDLALRRNRIGRLRRRGHKHQVDLVLDDQILCDLSGAVGIRLAVLDDDFHWKGRAADLDAGLGGFLEIRDDEVVSFGERGKWAGLRADVAEFYGARLRDGRHRDAGGKRGAGRHRRFEQRRRSIALGTTLVMMPPSLENSVERPGP